MALKTYGGPGLGRGGGWECPNCGGPNASARGTKCVHCGFPPEDPKAELPIVGPKLATDRDPEGAESSPLDAPLGSNAVDSTERVQMVRRYKLIEYYGPPEWVEKTIKRSLTGAWTMGLDCYLIGTEVSEQAVSSQVELLQRMTDARASEGQWLAMSGQLERAQERIEAPQPTPQPTQFEHAMKAMEDVMQKDARYAHTIAAALDYWAKNAPKGESPEQWINDEELTQVVQVLSLLTPEPESTPEVPA